MQMPLRLAIPLLCLALFLTALGDVLSPAKIWFGPVYLLVIGFAAWTLGRRHAFALGVLILVVNVITGNASAFPYETDSAVLNFAIKFVAVSGIVFLLGAAREALEREWRLARTDQLTGALNRQAFFEVISANALSPSWSVLIYADLDGLKHINDSMGHKHGDSSIMAFARQVQSAIRKDDLFARVGGDEFVILMNVRDEKAGIIVAERLNHSLNVASYHDENTRLLSSLGVLILPPGPRAIDTELRAADMLMYEAKRMKIGLLVATAEMTSQAITLSRHLAQAQPANRRTAIRAHQRGSTASIDLAIAPSPVEQPTPIPTVTSQPDRLSASQR